MIRALLFRIALFALPFILYEIYLFLQRRQEKMPAQQRKPWTAIFVAGLLLVAASFVIERIFSGESIEGTFVPAHMQNGEVVPGHVEPQPKELGSKESKP